MTQAETLAAVERIQQIEQLAQERSPVAFGESPWSGWDAACRRPATALHDTEEKLRAFVRVEDPDVRSGWTGDVACVWKEPPGTPARQTHLRRLEEALAFRLRLGHTMAAETRAVTISRAAVAPLTPYRRFARPGSW